MPIMVFDDFLRRRLEVARARIVTEAFPELEHTFGFSKGEFLKSGEGTHPAFPIGDDGSHLRLLQHDFRNPNGVRIARAPPRQVACMAGIPIHQMRDKATGFAAMRHAAALGTGTGMSKRFAFAPSCGWCKEGHANYF